MIVRRPVADKTDIVSHTMGRGNIRPWGYGGVRGLYRSSHVSRRSARFSPAHCRREPCAMEIFVRQLTASQQDSKTEGVASNSHTGPMCSRASRPPFNRRHMLLQFLHRGFQ